MTADNDTNHTIRLPRYASKSRFYAKIETLSELPDLPLLEEQLKEEHLWISVPEQQQTVTSLLSHPDG